MVENETNHKIIKMLLIASTNHSLSTFNANDNLIKHRHAFFFF